MGKMLRLTDVTLTDTTAPRLPHSAGVAGVTHRFVAGHLEATDGSRVLSWPETYGGTPAAAYVGSPTGALLGTDAAAGIRYLDFSNATATAAVTQLRATTAATNPATLAVVIKSPVNTFMSVAHNGYGIHRLQSGAWSMYDGGRSVNGPNVASWVVIVATLNGATSTLALNGTEVVGTSLIAPTAAQGDFMLGDWKNAAGPQIAEVIRWNRVLSSTERTQVRTALRTHYPAAA